MRTTTPHLSLSLRFGLAVILIVAASLAAFYLLMQPPMSDLGLMAVFLSITALVSVLVSYAAYRLGWMHRTPSIRRALLIGSLLSSLLIFLNVWLTARLMFASQHDLLLATVLLFFASGIAVAMGHFFAGALNDRIRALEEAAHRLAAGELETRITVQGSDEIADLAHTFNEMAARLQDAARQQAEAESMRRDLIAWVSHDLQTPLASVRAIVEALADGVVEDSQTVQRYLRTAQRDIAALSSLIDDLFHMAQLDAGGLSLDLAHDSLGDLISDTLESFSQLAKSGDVELTGSVAPGVDPVWMDAPRIGRALNNLVGNALRHTPPGGRVSIQAEPTMGGVQVRISDTGEGIPPDDLPHVFDRFFRGEKSRSRALGGSGLGLAIARGIIEAHGGQIRVESLPDEYTCFVFILPDRLESG
jgi:signal transduction histidine kinase